MSFFLPALSRIKKNLTTGSPYDPPGLSGDPNSSENADWTPRGYAQTPYAPPSTPVRPTLPQQTPQFALPGASMEGSRAASPASTAPEIADSPYSPVRIPTSQPDIARDVYMPRLDNVYQQLDQAMQPQHVSAGKQILGALVAGVTKNPSLGGLVTGDTQRNRNIQSLEGQAGFLGDIIKGNQAQRMSELNEQNTQADIGLRGAQANEANRRTSLMGEPKPTPDESIWQGYLHAAGGDPVKANQMKLEDLANAKPGPNPTAEDKAVSDHLQSIGLPDTPANRDKARLDLATRARQPKEPNDNNSAISDYLAANKLDNSPTNRTKARQELKILNRPPNQQETTRADMAENLNENLDQLEEILGRRGNDLFGPIKGRLTGAKEIIGTNDPDIGTLKAIEDMMGRAQTSAHGMRNGMLVEKASQSILNSFKNGPDAVRAAIRAARSSVKTFQNDANPGASVKSGTGATQSDPLGIR